MTDEEAINILANCIDDYVVGDFCVGKFCPMEDECKDKECVFHEAIETVLNLIQKQQEEIRQYEKALHDQIIKDYDMEIKLKDELEKKDKLYHRALSNLVIADKIINEMAKYIEEQTGSCPLDMFNYKEIDCETVCKQDMYPWWIEDFKRKVEDK